MNFPIRTGFDLVDDDHTSDKEREFMRMVVSLMKILCEDALKSAARYCKVCGRSMVNGEDMIRALKYESRVFWDKDIDDRFIQSMEEERQHTYDTTDDEEETDEEESEEEDEPDETHMCEMTVEDACFRNAVNQIDKSWNEWTPDDPVKMMLKRAIDSTSERFDI
jgi:hypothetical protein